jgi:hypothetical protein
LRSKGRNDWALKLAREAVNCAPSEFVTWAKLTEVYIDMGMYDSVSRRSQCRRRRTWTEDGYDGRSQALLTLNSCPMFTFNERYASQSAPLVMFRTRLIPDSSSLQ